MENTLAYFTELSIITCEYKTWVKMFTTVLLMVNDLTYLTELSIIACKYQTQWQTLQLIFLNYHQLLENIKVEIECFINANALDCYLVIVFGATTLSILTISRTTLSIKELFGIFYITPLYQYAECHNAECRYAEFHNAECRYAECRYAECRYNE